MKNIILTAAALVSLSWGVSAQSEDIAWPIEPKNDYAKELLAYYGYNQEVWVVDDEYVALAAEVEEHNADAVRGEIETLAEKADAAWRKFVWLTNENRLDEAIMFYAENRITIDCIMANSQIRLYFHDDLIGNIAAEVMPEVELYVFMVDIMELDEAVASMLYEATGSEDTLYDLMYIQDTLDTLYYRLGRYDDMLALIERTEAVLGMDRAYKLWMSAQIYNLKGDKETTLNMLLEAKEILTKRIEDGENVEDSELALSRVLEAYEVYSTMY